MPTSQSLSLAVENLNRGEFSEAERICAEVLHAEPQNAKACYLRGIANAMGGEFEQAIEWLENAIRIDAGKSTYHYNLALAFKSAGRPDSAIAAYREAIALKEDFLEARNNLGNTLLDQGALDDALECFSDLVRRFPDLSDGHYNLGNLLRTLDRLDDAIKHYRRAVELDPDHSSARENLGRVLTDNGRADEAQAVWLSWLEHEPQNAVARHMLASASGENVPERCDDQYVRDTFDKVFAQSFDRQLAQLEYNAPALVITAVKALHGETASLDVLDAGCGTGLCGPLVRPLARRLAGVDLSEDMLREADKRAIYDETIVAELTQYMQSQSGAFDLIISADTLCYFGELGPVLSAAAACLRSDGVLVFTVERNDEALEGKPYRLQQHGRYCHAKDYVNGMLDEAGFRVLTITEDVLRREIGQPVHGFVVTAKRSA